MGKSFLNFLFIMLFMHIFWIVANFTYKLVVNRGLFIMMVIADIFLNNPLNSILNIFDILWVLKQGVNLRFLKTHFFEGYLAFFYIFFCDKLRRLWFRYGLWNLFIWTITIWILRYCFIFIISTCYEGYWCKKASQFWEESRSLYKTCLIDCLNIRHTIRIFYHIMLQPCIRLPSDATG